MRAIALTRVRLSGAAQNVCGISAQTFAVRGGAPGEDQLVGWVDHITLLDNSVLVEREGRPDELISLSAVASMRPLEDLKVDLLGSEEAKLRAYEAKEREQVRLDFEKKHAERALAREEAKKKPAPAAVASLRDDDGDVLRPEAAITFKTQPAPSSEADEAPRKGRKGKR